VSHDLRAPLRAIGGFARILVDDYGPALDPEARRYLGLVESGATRMSALVDDLLRFSRLNRQVLSPGSVDTAAIVRASLEELAPEPSERTVAIHVDALPRCYGDERLLRQVWTNLLANAIKFTRGVADPSIHVGATNPSEGCTFGLWTTLASRDMRRSHRRSNPHHVYELEGTVSACDCPSIVVRHGGSVWAYGKPREGATFFSPPARRDRGAAHRSRRRQ
jgi:light-regulated signal transduction histidine kinase (bacteriophytochrome)